MFFKFLYENSATSGFHGVEICSLTSSVQENVGHQQLNIKVPESGESSWHHPYTGWTTIQERATNRGTGFAILRIHQVGSGVAKNRNSKPCNNETFSKILLVRLLNSSNNTYAYYLYFLITHTVVETHFNIKIRNWIALFFIITYQIYNELLGNNLKQSVL